MQTRRSLGAFGMSRVEYADLFALADTMALGDRRDDGLVGGAQARVVVEGDDSPIDERAREDDEPVPGGVDGRAGIRGQVDSAMAGAERTAGCAEDTDDSVWRI